MNKTRNMFSAILVVGALGFGLTAAGEETRLEELANLDQVTVGWGMPAKDMAISGQPLQIGGEKFAHGLGVHAASFARLELNGKSEKFHAMVGVNELGGGSQGSVEFIVGGDGKELFRSGVLKSGDKPKAVDVSLAGVKKLKLEVTDGGNGPDCDHADWADAVIAWTGTAPKLAGAIGFDFVAEPLSTDPVFAGLNPAKAPAQPGLYLKVGDRLAICGDSITQQALYSRIIETYLTVCVPELKITARQYGWSGETAEGFRRRMDNDCLRFKPTLATICYGMNDFRYRPYDEANDKWYRENMTAVVKSFKGSGARVIVGSPGCVGKVCSWVAAIGTLEQHNQHLCMLHNSDIEIAAKEGVRFADVFCPLYAPDMAGHLVMAYAFLSAMGLDGDIGTFTVNLAKGMATATAGHTVNAFTKGELMLTSTRYPFCASGPADKYTSVRSGMTLVPFNEKLNRLMLVAKGGKVAKYKVTWGVATLTYTAQQLAKGVNLAADFEVNPFSEAFNKVDGAVAGKQGFEIGQIQQIVHGAQGRPELEPGVAKSEGVHAERAAAIQTAFVPVKHAIKIEPLNGPGDLWKRRF
ncbi:MAG: NPCBM/NEW2 domain-containing protein [Kiritimatiellaeota bacterium]|nr:NPCBM/NEW2 domain-containing protein [Kiritimatiellota bacterium]